MASTSIATQIGLADTAKNVSGNTGPVVTDAATLISGSNLTSNTNSGIKLDHVATVGNIIVNDTAATATLAAQFSDAVSQLATQTTEVLGNLVKNFQASAVAQTSPDLAAQIAATPVDDTVNKPAATSLWWILGGLGAIYAVYHFRK